MVARYQTGRGETLTVLGRRMGAFLGCLVAVGGTTLLYGLLLLLFEGSLAFPSLMAALPIAAIIVGASLGYRMGPRAAASAVGPYPWGLTVRFALLAIILGSFLVAVCLALLWDSAPGLMEVAMWLAFAWAYGLILFGLQAFAVTMPAAIAWTYMMRRLARAGPGSGTSPRSSDER